MNRNEPAFARQGMTCPNGEYEWSVDGLTKREYAAIQILNGILSHSSVGANGNWVLNSNAKDRVAAAVQEVDALFDELEATK